MVYLVREDWCFKTNDNFWVETIWQMYLSYMSMWFRNLLCLDNTTDVSSAIYEYETQQDKLSVWIVIIIVATNQVVKDTKQTDDHK